MPVRCLRQILIIVAMAALSGSALPQIAADDPRRKNDRIVIPPGQSELVYQHADEIPHQLRAAIRCGFESWLPHIPVRIIRPDVKYAPLIALAPCGHIVASGVAFTIGRWWQPAPIHFVTMAHPQGFEVTTNPGFLQWRRETQTLTALRGTDMCGVGSSNLRYTYSYRRDVPFILIKIEHQPACSAEGHPWTPYWEAPAWQAPKHIER